MFKGSACLLRACRRYPVHNPRLSRRRSFSSTPTVHSTLRQLSKGHHRRVYVDTLRELAKSGLKYPKSNARNKANEPATDLRNQRAMQNNEKHLAVDPEKYEIERAAAKEVEWINDPLRLANRVLSLLRDEAHTEPGAFDRALGLVRASEKRSIVAGRPQGAINNVVSWNHLIDWCMENKRPREALKVYNEMKKRGHKPDAHSYTIMLRGFAANIDKPNTVTNAMTVYQGIRAANSQVKQNTMHLNAAANVFARAGDMDSLWLILGQARDRGPGSPDSVTYTIVLNALQRDLIKKTAQVLSKDEGASVEKIFDTAVEDGRRLWLDVVRKWQDADISVDEPLVCAMGRLLLMSKKTKDVMDVFKLVQQTMKMEIPSRLESPVQHESSGSRNPRTATADGEHTLVVFRGGPREQQSNRGQSTAALQGPGKALFATPGNNTLSMLLEAATVCKKIHWGKAYWELLTDLDGPYAIRPDSQNVVAYLRLLRLSRSSKAVVQVLQREWPADVRKKLCARGNFVIAMSTCIRDKNNPNVFEYADQIVDIMQHQADAEKETRLAREEEEDDDNDEKGADPEVFKSGGSKLRPARREPEHFKGKVLDLDPKVMTMYLNIAMLTTRGINPRLPLGKQKDGDLDFERNPNNNNTFRALRRIDHLSANVLRMLKARLAELEMQSRLRDRSYRLRKKDRQAWFVDYTLTQERLEDLVGLLRALVGAYDRILVVDSKLQDSGNGPLDVAWLEEVRLNKAKFNTWLGKIDVQTKKGMGLTKSGLKSEYDPAARADKAYDRDCPTSPEPDLSYGQVDEQGRLIPHEQEEENSNNERNKKMDDDEWIDDNHALGLARTPGAAKLHNAVSKQIKIIQTQRQNAKDWLSRRQRQEKEKARRQDRAARLYPDRRGRERQDHHHLDAESDQHDRQHRPGWGGGYDRMAERMGLEETSGMVDLHRRS